MARNPPPSSSSSEAPPVTTETFRKQYGRGSGYPAYPSHHGHHPPPPHHYSPSQYPPGQHAHPPYPPPGHRGGPPPAHGHRYHHPPGHHQPWYYPPRAPEAQVPSGGGPPPDRAGSFSSRRNASGAAKNSRDVPPNLVTPKSHDSETFPPVAADAGKGGRKKPSAKSNKKANNSKGKGKKEKGDKSASSNDDKEVEMEEELKVAPMKQDFHFYAIDHREEAERASRRQLESSLAHGTMLGRNKENELYLLTTLINARLIRDWEAAPGSTRAKYLKAEEADRKRFMGEEEVASRHCATLTARKRSPRQSAGVGRMGSFGLAPTAEVTSLPTTEVAKPEGETKRLVGEVEGGGSESAAKRVKAV